MTDETDEIGDWQLDPVIAESVFGTRGALTPDQNLFFAVLLRALFDEVSDHEITAREATNWIEDTRLFHKGCLTYKQIMLELDISDATVQSVRKKIQENRSPKARAGLMRTSKATVPYADHGKGRGTYRAEE